MKHFAICSLLFAATLAGQTPGNKSERLEWFRDQGFGLFIHWSVDSQLGVVISHSLAGASDDFTRRFFIELPQTFNPRKFHPQDWAALAKLAGVKYVVFTTKHHSGFAMWDTATTPFSIGHTPFQRDIFGEVLSAFREQGIAPGIYFSPDDFHWLHSNGVIVDRRRPETAPANNPGLMALDKAQVREPPDEVRPHLGRLLRRAARGSARGSLGVAARHRGYARRHQHTGVVRAGCAAR